MGRFAIGMMASAMLATAISQARGENTWILVGLENRPLSRVTFSPSWQLDRTIFAADEFEGKIYRSTNNGLNWDEFSVPPAAGNLAEVALSPGYRFGGADQRLLVTGSPATIQRSSDSGATWLAAQMDPVDITWGLAISPAFVHDGTVFAATNSSLQKSIDGGVTFVQSGVGLPTTNTFTVAVSPAFAVDHTVFTGLYGSGQGVYKSIDGGANWTPSGAELATTPSYGGPLVDQIELSPAFAIDQTLFAVIEDIGLFRSKDGGVSWQELHPQPGPYFGSNLALSPNFAIDRTILAPTSEGLKISLDDGDHWNTFTSPPFAGTWGFAGPPYRFSPDYATDHVIYVATSNGLWMTVIPEPTGLGGMLIFTAMALCRGRRRA